MNSNSGARSPRRRLVEIAVFVGFLLGATVFTYPLVWNLDDAVKDIGDPLLDTWAIAWVAHQLPRDPLHLFDANRFYPETGTLALTDPMLAISIPVAPVQWLFNNPVLTLNVAMLLTLALSGYGMYRLVSALTGSGMAGAVGGSIFTFNAYRLSHLAHVHRAIGLEPPERGRSLFPGVLALVLGLVALARPSRRAGLYALIGVFGA